MVFYAIITNVIRLGFFLLVAIMPCVLHAEQAGLVSAMQNTYLACVDIDDSLAELKKMAGISTAVGAVGAGLGTGAFAVGMAKVSVDAEAEKIEARIESLRAVAAQGSITGPKNENEIKEAWPSEFDEDFLRGIEQLYKRESINVVIDENEKHLQKLTEKSKKMGNWRTGLSAGATATSVANAIVSGLGSKKIGIEESIAKCNDALQLLSAAIVQARLNGEDVAEAETIVNACRGFDAVDASKISKMSTGSMVSSIVGATTGATGTVLSAVANSESVRVDNTDNGKNKEKNLNAASNVLTAGTTVANVVSTALSAVQIAELKKIVAVSEPCSNVLK